MARSFDFNAILQETLETRLDAQTVLHVTTPPERVIEQLAASQEELESLKDVEGKEMEKVRASYRLAAEIISCNTEGVKVTAEDLRDKYKLPPVTLALYLATYMDFINEFHAAKN